MNDQILQTEMRQQVVRFFENAYGQSDSSSIHEIVATEPQIEVQCIRPQGVVECLTLFTTGMSYFPLEAADGEDDEFRFAELFIQLPRDWMLEKQDLANAWPIQWLRRIAQFPHRSEVSLGPGVVLANESEEETFSDSNAFTGMLVMAEQSFVRSDQAKVQLYRLLPLYWDEVQLEKNEGLVSLLNLLDDNNVGFVVDMNRPNLAGQSAAG